MRGPMACVVLVCLAGCTSAPPTPSSTPAVICPPAAPSGYVCAPPPPSALCKYGPHLVAWGTGWIAKHVLSADDLTVLEALKADLTHRCARPAQSFRRA